MPVPAAARRIDPAGGASERALLRLAPSIPHSHQLPGRSIGEALAGREGAEAKNGRRFLIIKRVPLPNYTPLSPFATGPGPPLSGLDR